MVRRHGQCKPPPAPAATSDLLNFHFASPTPSQHQNGSQNHHNNRNNNGNINRQNKKPSSHQQYSYYSRRTKEDRASARKKAASNMFYLHSSSDHAFVISRISPAMMKSSSGGGTGQATTYQQYSFQGSDEAVSWESVRIVKYLSSIAATGNNTNTNEGETCPICLDNPVCPRVTKCGHIYCLTCIIQHVQAYYNNATHSINNNDNNQHGPTCPCCSIPVHLGDLRPVECVSVTSVALGQHVTLQKLHRCNTSVPFLPLPTCPRREAPHAAPSQTDPDANYSRFTYVDPAVYHSLLEYNLAELVAEQSDAMVENTAETRSRLLAKKHVQGEVAKALSLQAQELELMERFGQATSGVYTHHPKHLLYASSLNDHDDTIYDDDHENENGLSELSSSLADATTIGTPPCSPGRRSRVESVESAASSLASTSAGENIEHQRRRRGDSMVSQDSTLGSSQSQSKKASPCQRKKSIEASMFLKEGETAFYQTQDGKLCFLNGFNMNCLKHDFSPFVPGTTKTIDEGAGSSNLSRIQQQSHSVMPLPDVVQGTIVEIERVHLTPEARQRLRFLSHVPLYSDVTFVELSLGILSPDTRKRFAKEFGKRKQTRQRQVQAEKRADERSRRIEQKRIDNLKSRIQRVDPEDEFFHAAAQHSEVAEALVPTGEDFGPAIGTTAASTTMTTNRGRSALHTPAGDPSISFSAITRTSGAFPALGCNDTNFPSLGESAKAKPTAELPAPSWGSTAKEPKSPTVLHPLKAGGSVGSKKKKKPKKIQLFSTGGGHSY